MARGLNRCMIIGNVGRDPEMRYTPNGNAVTTFSVAVSRVWSPREGGEQREETDWFRVTAWSKLAETCNQYLTKGQRVYIEGRVSASAWTGQDGQARASLELTANDMIMLSPKGEMAAAGARDDGFDGPDVATDDIPF
ncbi:MAG: single-stranded DNA-binding protein [Chloroflexota bacterium]|nr:single-stranded DNA-binding protein [Chloroflexota bacterium]